ncbi:hypothetical protein B9Z55_010887 [Caenorhabditis nigoni]|uniref:Uncharacterized protein n=1 Tax=Caenorhabditis nigoni TaxID=1611254 RepID=A0A2G5UHP0_9PELO|nr:hypothetical protein B9Z55_010887 [Caenorhabditis nigoni]
MSRSRSHPAKSGRILECDLEGVQMPSYSGQTARAIGQRQEVNTSNIVFGKATDVVHSTPSSQAVHKRLGQAHHTFTKRQRPDTLGAVQPRHYPDVVHAQSFVTAKYNDSAKYICNAKAKYICIAKSNYTARNIYRAKHNYKVQSSTEESRSRPYLPRKVKLNAFDTELSSDESAWQANGSTTPFSSGKGVLSFPGVSHPLRECNRRISFVGA